MNEFAKFRKIDAHSHIGAFGSPFHVNFNGELLLKQMEEYNIEKTILTASGCHSNQETRDVFRAHPDKVIPLVWSNPAEGQKAYDELEKYLTKEGFAGAKLQPLFDGYTADDQCIDPLAEICKKYGKPLFVHCGHPPFSLPWQIGLLAERHKDLPIVMIHMGHGHGVYIDASIKMAMKYDNLWLECSGMPMGCQIANAYRTVGSERVMFGIDSPFHHPSVEIQRVMSCGLSDTELEDVFYNNAARFMKL